MSLDADRLTHADRFREDPRVAEARTLLAAALAEHSDQIHSVQSANTALTDDYQQRLRLLTEVRGAAPFYPYLASGLGNGPWVELADGSVKLDFISGIGVYGLGHSHPQLLDAAFSGALEDVVMQGNLQQHPPSIRLAQRLVEIARSGKAPVDHCLLSTSGAMANENALKIALHAKQPADRILCFDNCFAGRSLALAALTDRPKYREGLPLTLPVDYLPYWDVLHPVDSTERAVSRLKQYLTRNPGRYAAMWIELVAGEGGYYPGNAEYFRALLEPLKEAGIPIIFDEVQTFGRLSRPFAFDHFGLGEFADVVTVGKMTQVCATLYRKELKPSAPILSQTFTGSSTSISCGLAVLETLFSQGCFDEKGSNMQLGAYVAHGLERLSQLFPGKLSGPYGLGMMVAFTPGDGTPATAKWFLDQMFQSGLMGFSCGADPTRVRFLPPPAVTSTVHIDAALSILAGVLGRYSPT